MIKILLLLSLFCVDNNIYIVTDDSEKSKIINVEMNRNWVKKDVNLMKGVFDEEYFIKICGLVYNNRGSNV